MTEIKASQPSGFFAICRDVMLAGVFATGLWVLGEQFEKLGYNKPANICNFLSCIIFLSVFPFEIIKHRPRYWIAISIAFLPIVAAVWSVFFILKPIPQPTPYPHFEFRVLKQYGDFNEAIELTNNFFTFEHPPASMAYLFCPTNINLKLDVQNLGPTVSENTRITISVSKSFSCEAPGYENEEVGDFISLTCHPPDLLPGDSWSLPEIRFRNPPIFRFNQISNLFCIMTRAKDSPAELVVFDIAFIPASEPELPVPIVGPTLITNGIYTVPLPIKVQQFLFK